MTLAVDGTTVRIASEAEVTRILNRLREVNLMWRDPDPLRSSFLIAGAEPDVTGFVGVEVGAGGALLRSLYVEPEHRRAGLGRRLVAEAEALAINRGADRMYLFSTGAGPFFESLDYRLLPVAEVVAAIPDVPQVEWYVAHPTELANEVTFVKNLANENGAGL